MKSPEMGMDALPDKMLEQEITKNREDYTRLAKKTAAERDGGLIKHWVAKITGNATRPMEVIHEDALEENEKWLYENRYNIISKNQNQKDQDYYSSIARVASEIYTIYNRNKNFVTEEIVNQDIWEFVEKQYSSLPQESKIDIANDIKIEIGKNRRDVGDGYFCFDGR